MDPTTIVSLRRTPGGLGVCAFALLLAAAVPSRAQAQGGSASAMDGQWHFTVAPYFWMTGIKGDVSVASLPSVPIDASFSDIMKSFDIGLQGRFEARKDRVGLSLDFMYTNLGAPVASSAPIVGALDMKADVRQLITEGTVFYRVATGGRADNPAHLDLLVGARYTGTKTRLTAQSPAGVDYNTEDQKISWVDALAGVKFRAPLGSRAAFLGRADVAGFGSNVTWNLEGDLGFRAADHWWLGAGYRFMDIDYESSDGDVPRKLDVAYAGPRVWFAYAW